MFIPVRQFLRITPLVSTPTLTLASTPTPRAYVEGDRYFDPRVNAYFAMNSGRVFLLRNGAAMWDDVTGTSMDPTRVVQAPVVTTLLLNPFSTWGGWNGGWSGGWNGWGGGRSRGGWSRGGGHGGGGGGHGGGR